MRVPVLHIFEAPHRTKCPGYQILIGHGILMIRKPLDTTHAENKILGREQNMAS